MLKIEVKTSKKGNMKCSVKGDKCTLNECGAAIDSIVSFIRKNDPYIEDSHLEEIFKVCLEKEEYKDGKRNSKEQQ